MAKPVIHSVLALISSFSMLSAQSGVYRTPALSPDASVVAFSFQGDIWTMPLANGSPNRLTIHEAYESNPTFNSDGSAIAFTSNRSGNEDVFIMKTNGADLKRLTYHSAGDVVSDWTNQNEILFSTRRVYVQVEWDQEIHKILPKGGTPTRILDAMGEMAVASPDGKHIAFVSGPCRVSREAYKGPADLEIWIYNVEEKTYRQFTNNEYNDFLPRWKNNDELYFLNGSTGYYNIYSQSLSATSPTAITTVKGDGIRFFDYAQNTIVYEKGNSLYKLDVPSKKSEKIEISIHADYRFDPTEKVTYSGNINDYKVSPNGKEVAMVLHGEVFVKELDKEKDRTVNVSNHPFSDEAPNWLNDTTILFISDRDGQADIYKAYSDDPKTTSIAKALRHNVELVKNTNDEEADLVISPNGKKVAFTRNGKQLIIADLNDKGNISNEKVLVESWSLPSGVVWSPDSRFVSYSQQDLNFNREVFVHPIDGKAVNVNMHPRGDYSPVWSEDGSKLGFVSGRGSGNDNDIWFVWLKKSDWEKTKEDWKEGSYYDEPEKKEEGKGKKKGKEEEKDKKEEEKLIEIDFEDIHERLVRVTSLAGNEGNILISKDGETFFFTARSNTADRTDLYKIKWNSEDIEQLTQGGQSLYGLSLSPSNDDFYALKRGSLLLVDAKGKTTGMPHKAQLTINHDVERAYVFDEAWSILNDRFYDPNFHGQDWEKLKQTYKPWALSASTSQDYRYIMNWMLGQLNASHMGMYGGDPEKTQRERTARLGVEVKPLSKGVEVMHVVANSAAYRQKNKLEVGDVILAVNGKKVEANGNFYELLEGEADSEIWLTVKSAEGADKDIIVRPSGSMGMLLYEEWVAERKRLVEEYSKGKLGYIHIRGMDMQSFERFERELMASGYGKEGIVIDVRYNGGGWTTDYLMAVLNVQQHAYTVPRGATDNLEKNHTKFKDYYPYSERLPLSAWTKPSVALCNESSYSNAEIFSHAYKNLGIGTLVGEPTFGAVISTGGAGLLDGSFIRLPFRGWYVKADGMNMENGPAVPDVILPNSPDYKANGVDEQLKKAVEVLLEELP